MISDQIFRSSSILTRFLPLLTRFGSTLSKESSTSQNKSTSKDTTKKSASEYLAADMYNYTPFSYYDMEVSIIKHRLSQPSPYVSLNPPKPAPQNK